MRDKTFSQERFFISSAMQIQSVNAREILDSRGIPTLEVTIFLVNGVSGRVAVPSGTSRGRYEAWELRDGDSKRYYGQGVEKAIKSIRQKIGKAMKGKNVLKQQEIDAFLIALDGTEQKSRLGANTLVGVSLACARTAAGALRIPLYRYLNETFYRPRKKYVMPTVAMNVINGGKHGCSSLDIQEFFVIPRGLKRVRDQVRAGYEIFHALGELLKEKELDHGIGLEGGYALHVKKNEEALHLLRQAGKRLPYSLGKEIFFGLDLAASEFYESTSSKYVLHGDGKSLSARGMQAMLLRWLKRHPLILLEDPFEQDAWEDWSAFTKEVGETISVAGDDLFVTNIERLREGVMRKAANTIVIKPNQVGTLTETMQCIQAAKQANFQILVSHRSGETSDDFIADLAVAVAADFVKFGCSRGERVSKYNRLLEIEEELHL